MNSFEARESGTFVECRDGDYVATVSLEYPAKTARGDAVKWLFRLDGVRDKDGRPVELWGFSTPNLTSASKFGAWAEAVLGRTIDFRGKEKIAPSDLSGKRVKVEVRNQPFTDNQGINRQRPVVERLRALTVPEALDEEKPADFIRCWCGAEATAYAPDGETPICETHAEAARKAAAP
jgi:hypothetical protein